jgi:ribose transport system substrate-binding protein
MRKNIRVRLVFGALVLAVLSLVATACSSSSSSSTTTSAVVGSPAATGSGAGTTTAATIAAAKAKVAPFIGHPSPFPVTEKLNKVPRGATVAFMDCGLSYCALYWELLQQPAKMLGIHLVRIDAGVTAESVSTAFDSVVAEKPNAVIVMGIVIQLWAKQLKELQHANIPVVTQGITGTAAYGIVAPQGSDNQNAALASLEANYIPAEMSPGANVVYYEVPELSFTIQSGALFVKDLTAACPKCSVRLARIPAATIGTTSNNNIVSDLQAHPATNLAVFSDPDLAVGLPAALETAGIKIQTLNTGPIPANLQQIKDGGETAGLGADTDVSAWVLLDEAAREIAGQKPTAAETEGVQVMQFLTQKDITFDPAKGWTGYPDFAERFAKAWGVTAQS